jgi:hypothetical protein
VDDGSDSNIAQTAEGPPVAQAADQSFVPQDANRVQSQAANSPAGPESDFALLNDEPDAREEDPLGFDDDHALTLALAYTWESGTVALFDEASLRLMIDRNQRNPRRMKRFLNSFVLLYGLDAEWRRLGPKCLLDVLLLDTHFPEFMALFRAGTDADPVGEFTNYHQRWTEIYEDRRSAERDERLRDLEHDLPEQYPVLVQNDEFVTLIRSLHQADEWESVRLKLQRRRASSVNLPGKADDKVVEVGKTAPDARPGRVLWVTTSVAGASELASPAMERLVADGWVVLFGPTRYSASRSKGPSPQPGPSIEPFDVAVVEGADEEAVMTLLGDLYAEGFVAPIVAFLPRVTPSARSRLAELHVPVTSDPAELERYVWRLAHSGSQLDS